jgi:hypothetical protein
MKCVCRAALKRATEAYSLDRDFVVWPSSVRMAIGNELKNILLQAEMGTVNPLRKALLFQFQVKTKFDCIA